MWVPGSLQFLLKILWLLEMICIFLMMNDLYISHDDIIHTHRTSELFESNFRTHEMEYLDTLAHKYNYEILTIVINADVNVLHQRFMNRINNENRHAVHKAVDLSDINVFNKQILDDRDRVYYGKVLKLDSTNFDNIYSDKVITLVSKFIKE